MRILYKNNRNGSFEVLEVKYMCYDEDLYDKVCDGVIINKYINDDIKEGLYILSIDDEELYVEDINLIKSNELIKELYNSDKVDLSSYDLIFDPMGE
jgi:hypothetical protein